jgi:hypothetical protein
LCNSSKKRSAGKGFEEYDAGSLLRPAIPAKGLGNYVDNRFYLDATEHTIARYTDFEAQRQGIK